MAAATLRRFAKDQWLDPTAWRALATSAPGRWPRSSEIRTDGAAFLFTIRELLR